MKVTLYCQIGRSLDMSRFSINEALEKSGIDHNEIKLLFICWKTSNDVYQWLKENKYCFIDMDYDEGKGFIWNLYKGWNLGYEEGFKYSDYVCPIATDHAYYYNWLKNLIEHVKPNRITNCKLIEPGTLPSLHTTKNFGITTKEHFKMQEFLSFCETITKKTLILDESQYSHRLDAMPFICPKDVWDRFGPMSQIVQKNGLTGDTDFFNRCKNGKVEIVKVLDAISYHCGGIETIKNKLDGIYT